jgi:hypothetical protein
MSAKGHGSESGSWRKLRGRPGNHGGDWRRNSLSYGVSRCWSEGERVDSRLVIEGLVPLAVLPRILSSV